MKTVCYLNGRFVDVARATISPLDRGFLFGEGLFETWRTYRGRAYGIRDHLARMKKSAQAIGIPFDPDEPWEDRCAELARRNRMLDRDGAVRMTITRGPGPVTLLVDRTDSPTTLMLFRPLESTLADAKSRGVAVWPVSVGTGVSEKWRQVKSLNYLPAILGKREAKKHGCFEAVYHTEGRGGGTVLEGTTSNVFIVRRGVLRTAPISAGLLPGVTRRKTLRLARRLVTVKEERYTVSDMLTADEVFLTGSGIEVVPVVRVARARIGNGKPGPVALAIQRMYREEVARKLAVPIESLGD